MTSLIQRHQKDANHSTNAVKWDQDSSNPTQHDSIFQLLVIFPLRHTLNYSTLTHLSHVWINPQILTQTSWTQSQVQTEPFVTLPTSNTPRSFIYRLNVTVRLSYNSLNDTVGDNPVTFKPSQISLSKDQTSVFQSHLKCQIPSEKDKKAVQVL